MAAVNFVNSPEVAVDLDAGALRISRVFLWYAPDFGGRAGVLDFIARHLLDYDQKRFVETRGFKGAAYKGLGMEDLLRLQSPIVPIDFHGNPHFVVVRGLNSAGDVHLADPAFGNHAMSKEAFHAIWRDGIGFVVTQ